MRVHVKFLDWESQDVLEEWLNTEHWVPKGEQVILNYKRRYEVVRVVHSGQFYINEYCREIQ